ncbi:Ribosomal protein S21 [Cordyceps fumosorosea ARSEF 2679]|uniref:Ribosomal protein S21 n=1 Tax=Cordyceps fumosorosea (strain ARSEF 2679) TaxID=1081104 RepID=A0A167R5T2_CORFA|nr:Ribosomal protein S21 [Cordyceps fumosorosea ARSEF 2679]OAA58296.1 Ribosomal protein S21 [Cordyceps fumosorosea ARSEF 2679]
MNLADRRAPKPAPRVNPLIGGIQPKPQETAAPTPTKPDVQSTATTMTTPPPPPPPPKSASDVVAKSSPSTDAPAHPYSATSKALPFELDVTSILSTKAADYGRSLQQEDPLTRPRVRAAATTGRTIFVRAAQPGPNSAPTVRSALAMLGRLVKHQHIKTKYHSQKAHERPGLKRKRLASERWRSRFRDGFCAAYARVHELRKQGW